MMIKSEDRISFARLPEVSLDDIAAHMSDPRFAEHLPLLTGQWDRRAAADFVALKEEFWSRDGLGHWAILCDGAYAGWGGFQKERDEWDYGLVLRPGCFGLGARITRMAILFAENDDRIPFVTFLLPTSRKRLRAMARLGADFVGPVDYAGASFMKYRLETA